jgi:DNA polymerase III sliding clamp (beta) subunit (PCNA family)
MRLKVNEFKHALNMVAPAFQKSTAMPICEYVKIETAEDKVKLTASDLAISIIHEYKGIETNKNETILIAYKDILNYVKLCKNVFIELEAEQVNKMTININITAGSAKMKMSGESEDDFPNIELDEFKYSFLMDAEMFGILQKKALPFAADDDLRPSMSAVRMKKVNGQTSFASTNGYTASILLFEENESLQKLDDFQLLIPRYLKHLEQIFSINNELVTVNVSGSKIAFQDSDTTLIGYQIDENYPDLEAVLNGHKDGEIVKVNKQALIDELTVAGNFTGSNNDVLFDFAKDKIHLKAQDMDYGKDYDNSIQAESSEELAIKLPYDQVIKACKACQGDTVHLVHHHTNNKAVFVKSEDGNYEVLIMPMK